MSDLSLVSIDDMFDEIGKRCDSYVFAYNQNRDKDSNDAVVQFKEGLAALGLCEIAKRDILNNQRIVT